MSNPGEGNELTPKAGKLSLSEKVDLFAARMLSGAPHQEVLRGIQASEGKTILYSASHADWPVDGEGRAVPQICRGGLMHPLGRANLHFLIAGVPGTGKTLAIRVLMRSIFRGDLRQHLGGLDCGVIHDPKQEVYPMLRAFGCAEDQIIVLNPFDQRGHAWNLAADYTTQADTLQLARTIIPAPENHAQPFFPKAAVGVLAAVLRVYMRRNPGKWDLADVLLACMNFENLSTIFAMAPGEPMVMMALSFLQEPVTRNNVLAELCSHVMDFLPVASCWRHAARERKGVSVRDFLCSRDAIILLGANQTHRVALAAINRLFLKKLSEETLDHVDDGQWQAQNRTWLVLDEVRELGKVEGLADMINKGRSRGVCAVLGFQDYPGMKRAFGEHVAHDLTATCAHKLYLKLGVESADSASQAIGKAEIRETKFTRTSGLNLNLQSSVTDGKNWSRGVTGFCGWNDEQDDGSGPDFLEQRGEQHRNAGNGRRHAIGDRAFTRIRRGRRSSWIPVSKLG